MRIHWSAVVVIGLLVGACGTESSATPERVVRTTIAEQGETTTTTTTAEPSGAEIGSALLGAYVEPRGEFGDDARRRAVLDHEAAIGRPLGLVNEFFAFDKEWALDRLDWHLDSGRALMISWNGTSADEILSGRVDDIISTRAAWTRDLGQTILLRFFWEPDAAKGRRWGYHDDPTRYHDVWNHVRRIFAEEGATNAMWVWTPTTWHFVTGNAIAFYPGDDVVDVIGADGYSWSPCQNDGVETAEEVFGGFLDWANGRSKPIIIAEWGADADGGTGTKATFIDEMRELGGSIEDLLALVVFDAVDPGGRGCDWRIDSSPSALEAYRRLANDPAFAGSGEVLGGR